MKILLLGGNGAVGQLALDEFLKANHPASGKMEDFARVLYTIRAGKVIFARNRQ